MNNHPLQNSNDFLGQPKALFILFFTEMWERFSFYGMKALLIFYLTKYYLFSDQDGNMLIGSYAALVYAMPVIGGYIADNYLGFKKAIIFGGILLVLGHLGMAFEGTAATKTLSGTITRDTFALQIFYLSLAFIIVGVGFLKANISSLVGQLYAQNDTRRDSGFTLFYMGINLGSFLATIVCVWLGEAYGWSYGFAAAGIGMLLGLITFIAGQKLLGNKGQSPVPQWLQQKSIGIKNEWLLYASSIGAIFVVWQMVQRHAVVQNLLLFAGAISLAYIVYYAQTQLDKVARERLLALTILIIFTIVFWALFEQAYTSMNLFADRVLDKGNIPAGQFLSLNALFVVVLAPLFAWFWIKLGKNNPNTSIKFSLALLLVGFGFGALVLGIQLSGTTKVGVIWLVLAYFLHSCAELCLSPVGLSAVTKLSPVKIVGFMMGVWFLATASSEFIASILANIAAVSPSENNSANLQEAKQSYLQLFQYLFFTGLGCGVVLLAFSKKINALMHHNKQ